MRQRLARLGSRAAVPAGSRSTGLQIGHRLIRLRRRPTHGLRPRGKGVDGGGGGRSITPWDGVSDISEHQPSQHSSGIPMSYTLPSWSISASVAVMTTTALFVGNPSAEPRIRVQKVIELDVEPEQLMDAEVRPDGTYCLADGGKGEIRCFSATGRTLWQAGRKGEGPGEYRMLYRIGVTRSGGVFALDIAKMSVSQYGPTGEHLRTGMVPFTLRQVGDLVAIDDSTFALAGFAPLAGAASRQGVHLFKWDSTISHLRSVGRLPATSRPELLSYWGSGHLRSGWEGALLYQVAAPHEVQVFDRSGEPLVARELAMEVSGPDEVFVLEESADRFSIRRTGRRNVTPMGVESLSPSTWVLARRVTGDSSHTGPYEVVDVVGAAGGALASMTIPDSLSPMGLIDGPSSVRGFYGVAAGESGIRFVVFDLQL